jgi:head-tail adaptor
MKGPGYFRHRMTWERFAVGQGFAGGEELDPYPMAEVWARVEPQSADRVEAGPGIQAEVMHRVTMRSIAGMRPQTGDRLVWGDRVLDVLGAIDQDERGRMVQLDCREVVHG